MTRPTPSTALQHLRVLDLTRVRAGPTCCRVLADFGADVIKIEAPAGVDPNEGMSGARHGYDMLNLHRNKRSITLNLKKPEGLAVFQKMVETADVVVENFRPDVKIRLGIDYEALSALNPRIILASISGFGQDGPYANHAGFDQIAQGMGGLMFVTGHPGKTDRLLTISQLVFKRDVELPALLLFGRAADGRAGDREAQRERDETARAPTVARRARPVLALCGAHQLQARSRAAPESRSPLKRASDARAAASVPGRCLETQASRWIRRGFQVPTRCGGGRHGAG